MVLTLTPSAAPNPFPMENPNTPTPSGMTPGAASAGSGQTAARRFLMQFKMTACEEYSAPTPAAALSDAENDDAPPLGDFTASDGPEIVAEWDPVAEDWKDTPAAPPSPIRLIYGSLACVQTSDLILELQRRQSGRGDFAGDIEPCLVLAVTPSDLSEYWESDDAGNTHPGSATPTPEEWPALVNAFERWQDCGNVSDLMHALRDAWNDAKEDGSK